MLGREVLRQVPARGAVAAFRGETKSFGSKVFRGSGFTVRARSGFEGCYLLGLRGFLGAN